MVKIQELKVGDYVLADYEGEHWEGLVKALNFNDKEVCLKTDVQDFWFKQEALRPIPLNDEQVMKLNFVKQENEDGSVKYSKGAFRIFLPDKNNFSTMEIWYREDRRRLNGAINVHQLQNHHYDMTKINLTRY